MDKRYHLKYIEQYPKTISATPSATPSASSTNIPCRIQPSVVSVKAVTVNPPVLRPINYKPPKRVKQDIEYATVRVAKDKIKVYDPLT